MPLLSGGINVNVITI